MSRNELSFWLWNLSKIHSLCYVNEAQKTKRK